MGNEKISNIMFQFYLVFPKRKMEVLVYFINIFFYSQSKESLHFKTTDNERSSAIQF